MNRILLLSSLALVAVTGGCSAITPKEVLDRCVSDVMYLHPDTRPEALMHYVSSSEVVPVKRVSNPHETETSGTHLSVFSTRLWKVEVEDG
jgi:hypothetical protein